MGETAPDIRAGGTGAAETQLKDEIVSCFISVGCLHGPGSPRSQQLWWSRQTNRFPPEHSVQDRICDPVGYRIPRAKNRFARRFTRKSVPPEPRDCANPPQGRSAPLNMPTNAPPSTRTSASRSTGQNTNPTLNLSAPLSTSRIASLNGGVMATTRCGLRLRELARMFPTTSARRSPRPTPSRLLTRSARTFPSRSAFLFLARSASPSPTRFAPASPSQNARTFLASNATLSTKGSPLESADRSQRRFATRLQSMHRSLSLSTF